RPRSFSLVAALALGVGLFGAAGPATAEPGAATLLTSADDVQRVYGADRVGTAIAASTTFSGQGAGAVVLTRSDTFADALAGAPLASDKGGPLLMTSRTELLPSVAAALKDSLKAGGTVYMLGDTNALSAGVEQQIRALGFAVQRVAGPDRFATAVEIAKLLPAATSVALVTGWNYPDGLAAGALMGVLDEGTQHSIGVVLLSDGANIGATTLNYLNARQFATKAAIGGVAATAAAAAGSGWGQLRGNDRYETAAVVAQAFTSTGFFKDSTTVIGVATGENWPDALAGSGLLAYAGGPMILTRPGDLPAASRNAIVALQADARSNSKEIEDVLVFGDTNSVSATVFNQVVDAVK
ncbi:MAG: cell wall-binding repeat-containing protein, partial [Janthinobacterium lividum]